jgi:hypothetical protein
VDIPFIQALHRAWDQWPPLRKFVAAALGHKPKRRGNLDELLAMFPDGTIR